MEIVFSSLGFSNLLFYIFHLVLFYICIFIVLYDYIALHCFHVLCWTHSSALIWGIWVVSILWWGMALPGTTWHLSSPVTAQLQHLQLRSSFPRSPYMGSSILPVWFLSKVDRILSCLFDGFAFVYRVSSFLWIFPVLRWWDELCLITESNSLTTWMNFICLDSI